MSELLTSVFVSKTTAVTGLGLSLRETWNRISNGESAIRPITRFSTERLYCHSASCVNESLFTEEPNLVCGIAATALQDLGSVPPDTMIIWTGIKGNAESVQNGSQEKFVRADDYLSWAADKLGLMDSGFEINAACVAFTLGITLASQLIASGARENVLVCGADVVSRFAFTGFTAMRAISDECRPFDQRRNGLAIGDGAAAMLLCNEQSAM